jgi:hypothetical protein
MVFDEMDQDVWTLKNLRGKLLNMEINISGELINADALANLRLPKRKERDRSSSRRSKGLFYMHKIGWRLLRRKFHRNCFSDSSLMQKIG